MMMEFLQIIKTSKIVKNFRKFEKLFIMAIPLLLPRLPSTPSIYWIILENGSRPAFLRHHSISQANTNLEYVNMLWSVFPLGNGHITAQDEGPNSCLLLDQFWHLLCPRISAHFIGIGSFSCNSAYQNKGIEYEFLKGDIYVPAIKISMMWTHSSARLRIAPIVAQIGVRISERPKVISSTEFSGIKCQQLLRTRTRHSHHQHLPYRYPGFIFLTWNMELEVVQRIKTCANF